MPHDPERTAQVHQAIELMIRFSQLHHKSIERRFENTGLHRSQRRMLMHLSCFEAMPSQRKIADDFGISPACVARTLKALASEGYITRTDDEVDLRRNTVAITRKGIDTVSETKQTFETIDEAAFEGFDSDEIRQLIALLGRVRDNLVRLEESDTPSPNSMKGSASN